MLTEMQKEELKKRVEGMTREEQEYALKFMPVDMCLHRVGRELNMYKNMLKDITAAIDDNVEASIGFCTEG